MTLVDIDHVAAIIRDVARDEVMSRWQKLGPADIGHKSHAGDIVTIADKAAESALTQRLTALLPDSHVVGEEGVAADPSRLELLRSPKPVWVLDPIDGTRAYSNGKPHFDMMVALLLGGQPIAGWIYHPVSQELYLGQSGGGAFLETTAGRQRIAPRVVPDSLAALKGLVKTSWPKGHPRRIFAAKAAPFAAVSEPVSSGRNYARLLRGEAHFLVSFTPHPWDHLPGLLLLSEIGQTYARIDGTPYDPSDEHAALLTAPNAELWSAVRDTLFGDTPSAEGGT